MNEIRISKRGGWHAFFKKIFFNKLQVTLMCSQVEAIREALLLNPGLSQSVHLCPAMSQNPGADQCRRLSACVIWKLGLTHPAG